jgi:hypothetical protein
LRASVAFNAVDGDAMERSVCKRQMTEAADDIEARDSRIRELEDELKVLRRAIGPEPSRWVDSDGSYGEDTNLAAKYDGTLSDAIATARREIDPDLGGGA